VPWAGPITASRGAATAIWKTAENPKVSASVAYPVSATNRAKSAFVTEVLSMEYAATAASWTGPSPSASFPSPRASPIAKVCAVTAHCGTVCRSVVSERPDEASGADGPARLGSATRAGAQHSWSSVCDMLRVDRIRAVGVCSPLPADPDNNVDMYDVMSAIGADRDNNAHMSEFGPSARTELRALSRGGPRGAAARPR
jgi:hypothetical protein